MISFSLACSEGHVFDGWFASSEAYERQRARRQVACPVCGGADVEKALMAPAVSTARGSEAVKVAANIQPEPEMLAALRQMRKQLTDDADYVGDRFAEEARRVHYGEAEKRGIYGEATKEEVHSLVEEGIKFHPLPTLPEDHN